MAIPPNLDIEQFNLACSRHARGVLIVSGISMATMFAGFAVAIPFKSTIREFLGRQFGVNAAELLFPLIPCLPSLIVAIAGFCWLHRISKKTVEHWCAHCQKSLLGMRHLVVATKTCPYCGQRVLADPCGQRT